MLFNFIRTHDKSIAGPSSFESLKKKKKKKSRFCENSAKPQSFVDISIEAIYVKCKLTKMVTNTRLDMNLFWIHNERSN